MSAGYNSERSMQECDRNGERIYEKKMISWNVNGLRACLGKGFLEYLKGDGRRYLLHPGRASCRKAR